MSKPIQNDEYDPNTLSSTNNLLLEVTSLPKNTTKREMLLTNQEFKKSLKSLPQNLQNIILSEIFLNELPQDQPENYVYWTKDGQLVRSRPPKVICIGAKKCGTGAFQKFLRYL